LKQTKKKTFTEDLVKATKNRAKYYMMSMPIVTQECIINRLLSEGAAFYLHV